MEPRQTSSLNEISESRFRLISESSSILGLFAHNVNPVEVLFVFAFGAYHSAGADSGLGHHVVENSPVVLLFLEIRHPRFLHAIADAHVYTRGGEYSVDFREHLVCVGAGPISTENGVECALIDDSVEGAILKLKLSNITLLILKSRILFFV